MGEQTTYRTLLGRQSWTELAYPAFPGRERVPYQFFQLYGCRGVFAVGLTTKERLTFLAFVSSFPLYWPPRYMILMAVRVGRALIDWRGCKKICSSRLRGRNHLWMTDFQLPQAVSLPTAAQYCSFSVSGVERTSTRASLTLQHRGVPFLQSCQVLQLSQTTHVDNRRIFQTCKEQGVFGVFFLAPFGC